MVNHEITKSLFRLAVILFVIPIVIVYLVPMFEPVHLFVEGDRANWFVLWAVAITFRNKNLNLEAIGVSFSLSSHGEIAAAIRS